MAVVSIVGRFNVGTMVVGQLAVIVPVPGVYPSGVTPEICGDGSVSGDGSICGYSDSAQFGSVTPLVRQIAGPGGIPSAQLFGAVTVKAATRIGVSGVTSAQAFGAPTVKTAIRVTPASVPSAQAFGAVGVGQTAHPGGVASAQAFGSITTRSGFTKPVGGVSSAQAFGTVTFKTAVSVTVPGVPSAQAFGGETFRLWVPVGGVPSAQAFGQVYAYIVYIHPIRPADCVELVLNAIYCRTFHGAPICGTPVCGDGSICGGTLPWLVETSPAGLTLNPAAEQELALAQPVSYSFDLTPAGSR